MVINTLTINSGTLLLGFTAPKACPHCKNIVEFQIREEYNKTSTLWVIPTGTDWGRTFMICPVCQGRTFLTVAPIFTSNKKRMAVVELLDGGKERTREFVRQLGAKEQELVLKRLNNKKAYSLVQYVGS
jgi:hypothetical protein